MISIDKSLDVAVPQRRQPPNSQICAIDIGSKNVKLVIGGNDDGRVRTRLLTKETLKLGADIRENEGWIGTQKLVDLREVLSRFTEMGAAQGATKMLAIATHAVRNAVNNQEVVGIARELGIDLDIADGQREGVVGYLAATGGESGKIVSELGSRSCQVTWWDGAAFESRCIDDMGYERAFGAFIEPASNFADARNRYRNYLSDQICSLPGSMQCVAMASKSMAAFVIGCDKDDTVGMKVRRGTLEERISQIEDMDEVHFDLMKSTLEKADKILPGLIFVEHMLSASSSNDVLIAEAELPVGLIVESFSNQANRANRIEAPPVHWRGSTPWVGDRFVLGR
jgi:exopolyphosphatase/pppGpp-phosphohydrolase